MADDFYRSPGLGEGLGRLARGAGGMFSGLHDWSAPRSNRLMLAGMGMLSGKGAAEGWEGAMKGYVAGSALDKDTKRERALAEMMSDPSSTLGNLPAGDRAYVMAGGDEIVGPLMAARLKPADTPGSWDEYVLTVPPGTATREGFNTFLDQKAARNRITIEQGGKFADWTSLRGDLESSPGTKGYRISIPKLRSMAASVNDTTKMSDLQFVYGMAQIFDPTSVVREKEGQMVVEGQSLPAQIKGQLEALLNGRAALGSGVRGDLVKTAARRVEELRAQAASEQEWYQDIANRHGIDPRDIVRPLEPMPDLDFLSGDDLIATPE